MAITKYTYAHIKEVASTYGTLKEFREDHPALYAAAYRNWWLDDITEHMEVKRFWTEDEIFDAARPYKTRTEFQQGNSRAYQAARSRNILDDVCAHMTVVKQPTGHWTKEEIMKVAKAEKSYKDFSNNARGAYLAAVRMKITEEIKTLYKTPARRKNWTREDVLAESKNYKTRSEFRNNSKAAYNAAQRNGWLDEACEHMTASTHKVPRGFWTRDKVMLEAIKYDSKIEFQKGSTVAYQKAHRSNWLPDVDNLYKKKKIIGDIKELMEANHELFTPEALNEARNVKILFHDPNAKDDDDMEVDLFFDDDDIGINPSMFDEK